MKFPQKSTALIALTLAVLLLVGSVSVPVEAASSSELKAQLDELKKQNQTLEAEQNALQDQIDDNASEIQQLIQEKNVIDQEIVLINAQITNINAQIALQRQMIADKQDEMETAQDRFAELSRNYRERIRVMEEEGNLSYWSVLFEANSFRDLLDRLNMIDEIAAADRRRLKELSQAAQEVQTAQEALQSDKAAMEQTGQELEEAQQELAAKQAQSEEILRQLIAKGDEFEALLLESESLQEALMEQIAQTEKDYKQAQYEEWLATYVPPTTQAPTEAPTQPTTGGNTGNTGNGGNSGNTGNGGNSGNTGSSGAWVKPLSSILVTSPFGNRLHPILGYERPHNGVDLNAYRGQPIFAARSGRVTIASFQANGAGNYVSINHGDGFSSIYMHMEYYIVSAGQHVSAGQIIGYAGDSGLSEGVHLHFGISYNGRYINPIGYIQ